MSLLTLSQVDLSFAGPKLLDRLDFSIESGERICLLGRNGAGKSTLMHIIEGSLQVDSGKITRAQGLSCAFLTQNVPELEGSVFDIVASGLGEPGLLLSRYHQLAHAIENGDDPKTMAQFEKIQNEIDRTQAWDALNHIESMLTRMKLDSDAAFSTLSVGWKRRTLLGKAMIGKPDILLLDEPTNHLDIEAILWMEDFLLRYPGTLLFVTHDRQFLQNLATRIAELDRGSIKSYDCNYLTYLDRKAQDMDAEAKQAALFDKRLAGEEVWIRTGIKARRTRNEGRVRALESMREERRQRKNILGKARIQAQEVETSGRLILKIKNLSFAYPDSPLIVNQFSATVYRGDKVALIGPNGVGKSTLLKLMLGELPPSSGELKLGTNLSIAYFDQMHHQLDESATVVDSISDGSDHIEFNGRSKHVLGYLQDFLFTPERARGSVKRLSGGERNRLLLAKLFTKPANVLVLDEPTNDLDVETLDLLEDLLLQFEGTVFIVSHDRAFINHIATTSFVFAGNGNIQEYIGGYDDWQRQIEANPFKSTSKLSPEKKKSAAPMNEEERKELHNLPKRIETLEQKHEELHLHMAEPGFYESDAATQATILDRLKALKLETEAAYLRWEQLEKRGS